MQYSSDFVEKVIRAIKMIPYGYVTTYGHIALLAGKPRAARVVGGILSNSKIDDDLPWQRVINSKGFLSIKGNAVVNKDIQASLLKQEGISFVAEYKVDLGKHGWFENPNIADK